MTNYTTEENIVYLIALIIICILLTMICYFLCKCEYIKSKKQREYLKTLNDREKAVIAEYLHIHGWPNKKTKTNQKKENENM